MIAGMGPCKQSDNLREWSDNKTTLPAHDAVEQREKALDEGQVVLTELVVRVVERYKLNECESTRFGNQDITLHHFIGTRVDTRRFQAVGPRVQGAHQVEELGGGLNALLVRGFALTPSRGGSRWLHGPHTGYVNQRMFL
jgi:hypothetical protein